ncbi:MAG: hypothetical protein LBH05_06095 [Deferribacteraceae bacterium]|jgi:hypothetical protein|nr:hypothetical protein [Deferribacteraceae bacterium]
MDFINIENELNRMKAETLGEAGRKLEILSGMIKTELSYQERTGKIMTRLSDKLKGKVGWRKRTKFSRVKEKLEIKIAKSASALRNMKKHREELYRKLIMQREALGITDHEWINNFYMK